MPLASEAQVLTNVPGVPFVPNPPQFDALTQRNHHVQIPSIPAPGDNASIATQQLAQAGIISGVWLHFVGTLTIAGGTASTRDGWPFGLVENVDIAANFQNQVIHATGMDLHVHRFVSNPALPEQAAVDKWPSGASPGVVLRPTQSGSVAAGAHAMSLTWFLPIAADKSTLIGALYAQSASNLLTVQLKQTALANLLTFPGGVTGTLTGNFSVAVDFFDIPRDPQSGAVITPDLRRVHGLNYFDFPIASTGRLKVPLIPMNGNLLRLFLQIGATGDFFSPVPSDASGWTGVTLHYGANQEPQQWDLNSLVQRNVEQYGGLLPYGYVCLDFLRENPVRDAVVMNGVTDLAVIVDIATGTTIPANTSVHVVQETLYA